MSKQLQHRPTFKYKSNNLFSSNIHTRFITRMTKLEISQVIVFIEDNKTYNSVWWCPPYLLQNNIEKKQAFFLTNEHIKHHTLFLTLTRKR